MRLHRLTVTAFGPFGGTEHVDFDELSAAGLFLLCGPTGAGKTSVLDAVCYGLYGAVPGARQGSGLTLRSDHADPGTPTEVVLEATLGGRRLEITRRPEQPRPKKRGTGTTREKAQTWLREYVPDSATWKGLSRSHQEIGEEISQLLGMSREQFCQVVLLPQGDFATFLRADEQARGKLLGRLFDTGRFAAVEERLAELRRGAEKRVVGGDEHLLALAHRMAQAAGPAADGPTLPALAPGEPGLADAVLEWAAVARTTARERRDIARVRVRAAEAAHRAAQDEADAERERARLQRRRADAVRRADQLEQDREEHERVRLRLERARAAESVVPALDLRDAAEREHRAAVAAERDARVRLSADLDPDLDLDPSWGAGTPAPARHPASGDVPPQRHPDATRGAPPGTGGDGGHSGHPKTLPSQPEPPREHPGVDAESAFGPGATGGTGGPGDTGGTGSAGLGREARLLTRTALAEAGAERFAALERRLREELGSLAAARRAEGRAVEVAAAMAELDRQARADDGAIEEAAQWLDGWEAARQAHQRRVEDAESAAHRAAQLGDRIGPAEARLDAARRRDGLAVEVDGARVRLLRAREAVADRKQLWLDLKERRLRGIAAELAAGLRPGEPCAVCGAADHPHPARQEADHVDRAAEEAALDACRAAETAQQEADREAAALRESLARAEAAAGEASVEELTAEVREVGAACAEARTAGGDAHAAREALTHAEREYERRRAQRQDAERRAAARTSQREALAGQLAGFEAEVARARGAAASVAERAARLERQTALLAAAAEAVRNAERAALRLKEVDARLADAAYRAGFDTPRAAAGAALPDDEQRALRHRSDARRDEEAAVAAELADPQLAAAARQAPADPDAARVAVEAATRALRTASAEEAAARTRRDELDRLSARAAADARRLAPLREEYERVARLASLAAGTSAENERKMRLEAYVLAARLEQVAAAASARLRHMSAGRYTLVHSDARTSGRGRSGLGLHVIDSWTGHERDTATLSGGETFFASLSLALGLADVVTEEAGGTRLDTLFIDEGFGSLDEQTLDEVLDVLDSLRERDRTVGIVSHVAELRQRVPVRLDVTKSRTGSAVRHRTGRS